MLRLQDRSSAASINLLPCHLSSCLPDKLSNSIKFDQRVEFNCIDRFEDFTAFKSIIVSSAPVI